MIFLVVLSFARVLWCAPIDQNALVDIKLNFDDIKFHDKDEAAKLSLFHKFREDFQKQYTPENFLARFITFKKNLAIIDANNALEKSLKSSGVHGITRFCDLDLKDEFPSLYLNAKVPTLEKNNRSSLRQESFSVNSLKSSTMTSKKYTNWAGVLTTSVKDQASCGACWSFSVIEQLESDAIRQLNYSKYNPLSTQYLVDCNTENAGCSGGWMETAYEFLLTHGIMSDGNYPYISGYFPKKNNCPLHNMANPIIQLLNYTFINYNTFDTKTVELFMKNYVLTTGPLSIAVDATNFATYISGIYGLCSSQISLNHAVQIVGINLLNSTKSYWIVRNSWGVTFGQKGFIFLPYMINACGLALYPSYTRVKYSPSVAPTSFPSASPHTKVPTMTPSRLPSYQPSIQPVVVTANPSKLPSVSPSMRPTFQPSFRPTIRPTIQPTFQPTSSIPTRVPTVQPLAVITYHLPPSSSPSTRVTNTAQNAIMCDLSNSIGASSTDSLGSWICLSGRPYVGSVCKGSFSNWGNAITCDTNGLVTAISIRNTKLYGTLPTSLGQLISLTSLDLNTNLLYGPIPSSIGQLTGLTALKLFSNKFSSTIPSSISQLTKLAVLFLDNNQLTGRIPTTLGHIANLLVLRLSGNRLTGSVPSSFCSIKNLLTLNTYSNPGLTCYSSCLKPNPPSYSFGSIGPCATSPSTSPTTAPTWMPMSATKQPIYAPTRSRGVFKKESR